MKDNKSQKVTAGTGTEQRLVMCPDCGSEIFHDTDAEPDYPFKEWNAFLCSNSECDFICDAVFDGKVNDFIPIFT